MIAQTEHEVALALIAVVASLCGCLVFFVRWLLGRFDKRDEARAKEIAARDQQLSRLIVAQEDANRHLAAAIEGFTEWEREEKEAHSSLIRTQQEIVAALQRGFAEVNGKLDQLNH